jgi:hypothetical protein
MRAGAHRLLAAVVTTVGAAHAHHEMSVITRA